MQAKDERAAQTLLEEVELEEAGCFSIVLECIPASVAERVTDALEIPTIYIEAVFHRQCRDQRYID